MARTKTHDRIEVNPKVMMGKPVIRGTRITVQIIVEQLGAGASVDDVLKSYPEITREDVQAALQYAARALGSEEIHWLQTAR